MIRELRLQGFKSWADMGPLQFAPLTGFFGTNSSGKTSILQLLLMLKQTVESTDPKRVLHTGDDLSIVDLGTFSDLIHCHKREAALGVSIYWDMLDTLKIKDPRKKARNLFEINNLRFETQVKEEGGAPMVSRFSYSFDNNVFGMKSVAKKNNKHTYQLISDPYVPIRQRGRPWPLPAPIKFYGFPDEVMACFQNVGFLSEIVLELAGLFGRTAYLGPLREYPKRIYTWAGDAPSDVGRRGELVAAAMLAAREKDKHVPPGRRKRTWSLERMVAYWLREMGIIDSFSLKQIAENRKDYEVRVRKTDHSPEVLITDVGFGVSQVLPVLVMCYYVPEGSVLLLEQPELHLHPLAQSWLADVFINVVTHRNVQIIVESHSEHFLRRLMRRIAEEKIQVDKTALYFCQIQNSASVAERLDVDMFGRIRNWPGDFFGDEMGELTATTEAAMKRQARDA